MKIFKLRPDVIIIALLLFVSIAAMGIMYFSRETGGSVVVRVDGVEIERLMLTDDGTYSLNGGSNILVIGDGAAWLIEADCPDHICIKQGKISFKGQCITCLPNRLTVKVEGNAENNGIDIIAS